MYQTVIILDFGGQYKELIARRVRELGVYSEIWPCDTPLEKIRAANPIGVIFTGGPDNVYAPDAPACDRGVFDLGVPVLGICYGMQFMCHSLGGQVSPCDKSEYGVVDTRLTGEARADEPHRLRFRRARRLCRYRPDQPVPRRGHGVPATQSLRRADPS